MINKKPPLIILTIVLGLIISLFIRNTTGNTDIAYARIYKYNQAIKYTQNTDLSTEKYVYDEARLLTDNEISDLESLSSEQDKNAGIEIFILTHNDSNSTYPEEYIENFEDQLPVGDRVYFLYDVYRGEIFMEGYGLAETYIHSKRIDNIFDYMVDDLRGGHYYIAFETYINMSADYMSDDSELNYDHNYDFESPPEEFDPNNEYSYDEYDYDRYYDDRYYNDNIDNDQKFNNSRNRWNTRNNSSDRNSSREDNILLNVWFQLFISLIIGGVVVGIMAYNSSGRMTAGSRDYLDRSKSGLIGRRDQYIRSTVTKVRKPTQNNSSGSRAGSRGGFNSGGFRGGSSSGGRSHSSGGRKL